MLSYEQKLSDLTLKLDSTAADNMNLKSQQTENQAIIERSAWMA